MSQEIPESKKLEVLRLYYTAHSYDDIAAKLGIGKATVFSVIDDFRAGRFPGYENLGDLVADMRNVSVGLRKMGLAPAEGINLFILLKAVLGLGVEPSQLDYWVEMNKSVVGDGGLATSRIIQAAMKLARLEAAHGLAYEDVVAKYDSCVAGLKEIEEKAQSSRTELTQLTEKSETLTQMCRDLDSEKGRLEMEKEGLTGQVQELSGRHEELKKLTSDRQAALLNMEEKEKDLNDRLPTLEERATILEKEIAERTEVQKNLGSLGFSDAQLNQLHMRLADISKRYGKDGLVDRFFTNMDNYDSCLGLEATRGSLTREIDMLTQQRDSLSQLGEKLRLTPDEIGEAIVAVKGLQKRGVLPPAIVSYNRLLADVGIDAQSFQKFVLDFGGVEQALASKRNELETIGKQILTANKTLEDLKIDVSGTKEYLQFLKESTVKEIKELTGSAKGEVSKLCQDLQRDIGDWGNVRGEVGKYEQELKMARFFVKLPLSKQALSSLVDDISVLVVLEYVFIVLTWCQKKLNIKQRPPEFITDKYYRISESSNVELTDIIAWALDVIAEGIGNEKRV